jgi:transmembrane sensor
MALTVHLQGAFNMENRANKIIRNQPLSSQEQAAWFVTRLYSGELSAREEAQIRHWRNADPQHQLDWQQALQAYDISAQLYYRASYPARNERAQHDWRSWFASAASIVLVAVIMTLSHSEPAGHTALPVPVAEVTMIEPIDAIEPVTEQLDSAFRITQQQHQQPDRAGPQYYRTAVGEVSHVTLADGSTLSLNTDSELSIDFTTQQRLVYLSRGEVFFAVAKDHQRPFVIDTGERRIEVLGTQFNVRKRHDEQVLKISVLEGKVAVHQATNDTPVDPLQQSLLAGDIASYSSNSEVVQQNQQRQVSSAQTWRQGMMRFDNENLEHVIKEFNRYRTRKITIDDEQVKQLRISGVFHLANGENILTALESTLPIRVQRDDQQIVLSSQ